MKVKENSLVLVIVTDVILVLSCLTALFLYFKYGDVIGDELNLLVTSVLEDLNSSLAN